MVGGPIGTTVFVVGAIVLFVAGYLTLSDCGSGLSLILFGLALVMIGLAIFPSGGPVLLAMSGFIAFLLVVVGLVLSHGVTGCT